MLTVIQVKGEVVDARRRRGRGAVQSGRLPLVDAMGRLVQPSPLGGFVGVWLMFLALIVSAVAGIVAAVQNRTL
jgi:hypothetical protein